MTKNDHQGDFSARWPRRRSLLSSAGALAGGLALGPVPARAARPAPGSRQVVTLAGPWRFQIDVRRLGENERWFDADTSGWGRAPAVPRAWDCYEEALWQYEGTMWFATTIGARDFRLDGPGDGRLGRRVVLHFGRVMAVTDVWLDGQHVGRHEGGYVPFEFDVTRLLRPGQPARLVLRVDNRPRIDRLPAAKQIEWIQYGGILEPVRLISTARTYLDELVLTPRLSPGGDRLDAQVIVAGADAAPGALAARLVVEGLRGATATVPLGAPDADGRRRAAVSLPLPGARRWSPESPALYRVRVQLLHDGAPIDELSERIGVRAIAIAGRDILLNGKKLQIRGFNRYDSMGRDGPTPPLAKVREDLLRIKATGANTLRTHFPPAPDVLDLLDELGLLLVHELPINWWGVDEWPDMKPIGKVEQTDAILPEARATLEKMIRRDRNRACVFLWSMANESATHTEVGGNVMRELMAHCRALDPTRPVTFVIAGDPRRHAALHDADVVSFNVYLHSPRIADLQETVHARLSKELADSAAHFPDKPLLMTEFGREGLSGVRGDTFLTEEHQAAYIETMWRALMDNPAVSGGIVWSWADYHHRKDYAFYAPYGPFGVVTFDRKPKLSLAAVTRMWRKR